MKFFSRKLSFPFSRRTSRRTRLSDEEETRPQSPPRKESSQKSRKNSSIIVHPTLVMPFNFALTKRKIKYEPVNLDSLPRTDSRSSSTFKMMCETYGIRISSFFPSSESDDQKKEQPVNRWSSASTTLINESVALDSLRLTEGVVNQLEDVK